MDHPLEVYFEYHPPTTQERKDAHARVNAAALEFARVLQELVKNKPCRDMAFFSIQQARMFANQGIALDELSKS